MKEIKDIFKKGKHNDCFVASIGFNIEPLVLFMFYAKNLPNFVTFIHILLVSQF